MQWHLIKSNTECLAFERKLDAIYHIHETYNRGDSMWRYYLVDEAKAKRMKATLVRRH